MVLVFFVDHRCEKDVYYAIELAIIVSDILMNPPPPPGPRMGGGGWVPQLESLCGAESWLVLFSQSVVVLNQYIMCHHWCLHWLGPQGLSVSVHQVERSVFCIEYRKSPAVSCRLSGASDKPYFRYVSTTQCSADIVQAFRLSSRGPSYLVTKPWLLTISLNCIEMNRRLLVITISFSIHC